MEDIHDNIGKRNQQILEGRRWVEGEIRRIAKKFKIEIKNLEWNENFEKGQQLLALVAESKREVETFSEENIMDIPGTPRLREEILPRLETFVKKFTAPEEKIGF